MRGTTHAVRGAAAVLAVGMGIALAGCDAQVRPAGAGSGSSGPSTREGGSVNIPPGPPPTTGPAPCGPRIEGPPVPCPPATAPTPPPTSPPVTTPTMPPATPAPVPPAGAAPCRDPVTRDIPAWSITNTGVYVRPGDSVRITAAGRWRQNGTRSGARRPRRRGLPAGRAGLAGGQVPRPAVRARRRHGQPAARGIPVAVPELDGHPPRPADRGAEGDHHRRRQLLGQTARGHAERVRGSGLRPQPAGDVRAGVRRSRSTSRPTAPTIPG